MQLHGHFTHSDKSADHAEEESAPRHPTRHAQGPPQAIGVPQEGGGNRAETPGFRGRNRDEHSDDPDSRPRPPRRVRAWGGPQFLDDPAPHLRSPNLGRDGPDCLQGATDTATFEAHVEQALAPQLHPGDVVIWDNLKPHKAKSVVKAVKGVGEKMIPLPPSSPDYSPLEEMFSKVKGSLKSAAARTTDTLTTAIGRGLSEAAQQDIIGWFKSRATYAMQS
ncbi:transposase [Singulisphaera sp. GP187]|uniref:transposase n=1 Tax=Singulisphaera sp. GP187 TaxID=1882752 RepID=UPI002110192D|nr:transposase [Singulisphaera sp. GP187]